MYRMFPLNPGNMKSNADFGLYAIFPYLELHYDIYAKNFFIEQARTFSIPSCPTNCIVFFSIQKIRTTPRTQACLLLITFNGFAINFLRSQEIRRKNSFNDSILQCSWYSFVKICAQFLTTRFVAGFLAVCSPRSFGCCHLI